MNEQIRDLMLQAGFHMRPSIEGCKDGIDWSCSTHGYDQCVEKLIELTVRECISNLTNSYQDDSWSFHKGIYILREHFGVEE